MLVYVFSYDRPMQLEAALRSFREFSRGHHRIVVNYVTSRKDIKDLYAQHVLKSVECVERQNLNMEIKTVLENEEFVMFLHDDFVFYEHFDPEDFIPFLTQTDTYVSAPLHIGTNITHIRDMLVPPHELREQVGPTDLRQEAENLLSWSWMPPMYSEYHYPTPLAATVFRTDLLLQKWGYVLNYATPNEVEIDITNHSWPPRMLSYSQSVCYQIMDSQICKDRGILDMRVDQFKRGYRIDTEALNRAIGVPNACAFVHDIFLRRD
jgi:hypothetical protein